MTSLTASDFYTYLRPSKCELRVYFKSVGRGAAPPGPYEELLRRLGERHEASHLATFSDYVDLREGSLEERERKTKEAVENRVSTIYQAVLRSTYEFGRRRYEILGEPDFLIRHQGNYIIRDSKMSRRITESDHPEILRQLGIYGWLYERAFDTPPYRLEVHSGRGDIVEVPYDRGVAALRLLEYIANLTMAESEIYSPVGWSKCGGCLFREFCWAKAVTNEDVALVPDVDQGLAVALREQGISTMEDLLSKFDEARLSEFKRPWGKRMQRVGKKAGFILRMAEAISQNKEIIIQIPQVPDHANYVMFDLEGLPPQLDELEKIYLWGMQVFGKEKGDFMPAMAGFGEEGDKEGWKKFLNNARSIFTKYGDIPFVHWHHYERVKIDLYIERYGDQDGIAMRVSGNLLDLLPITQQSVALPLPSYSLKEVEKYVDYKRTMDEYGGDWAIAKYIEAIETEDEKQRYDLIGKILNYNREDLEATWAVLNWLRSKRSRLATQMRISP